MTQPATVLILMGSENDLEVMKEATTLFTSFGIAHAIHVASAHRSPEKVHALIAAFEKSGGKVIIAGAGMAAHLAGFVAAHTTLPVIGVPIASSSLGGLDALLATVQMPPGIPVATMAIGAAGARNAAILAAAILALTDGTLATKLKAQREEMARAVEQKDRALNRS